MQEWDAGVRVLRSGVDSLYLSFPQGEDFPAESELARLKQLAQPDSDVDKANAVYVTDEHRFEVLPAGGRQFLYILTDASYRIALSSGRAKSLPFAYVQIQSACLTERGVTGAVARLVSIVQALGESIPAPTASRADLFVDFVSSLSLDDYSDKDFICRARDASSYSSQGKGTGFTFGLGGVVAGRLYDKTVQIRKSGQDYLKPLWHQAGWEPGQTVLRLEFELKQEALKEHGVSSVESLLARQGVLWRYLMQHWLPNPNDATASRCAMVLRV